jgi:predicted nucleic acid-binding protein
MILIDTGPLVALCDAGDSLHAATREDLRKLARQQFLVCGPVIVEACFHLPHRPQRERLARLIEDLPAAPASLRPEREMWGEVFAWLGKYAEHEPDWADGYIAVLSQTDRRAKVWTYDREFASIWRRPDGTKIPLAVPPR